MILAPLLLAATVAAEKPPAHRVPVSVDIATSDAYACELRSDAAQWSGGRLRIVAEEGCERVIHFENGSAFLQDDGARASFEKRLRDCAPLAKTRYVYSPPLTLSTVPVM